ncbi:MAG: sugar phosphate isomerase/epimerase [Proteobacteria bacterium]|nr:sugar phosphate isomerase/epimerase [Pseudomonadota bacterium]
MIPADALSFQLYSARFLEPLEKQVELLAGLGFRLVEPYGGLLAAPDRLKQALDRHDLKAKSAHVGLDRLRKDAPGTARICRGLGIELVIVPAPPAGEREKDTAGWRALGRELVEIGKAVAAEGMRFGWHNHDFEFRATADGSRPIDLILGEAPDLLWEPDIAWIIRGGADPLAALQKYAGRIPACHVKDIAPPGQAVDEDGWADVGHGTLDWSRLVPAMHKAGVTLFVLEHDKPSDVARFARRSLATIKSWR